MGGTGTSRVSQPNESPLQRESRFASTGHFERFRPPRSGAGGLAVNHKAERTRSGYLGRVAQSGVEIFSVLFHDADPIHAYGHFSNRIIREAAVDRLCTRIKLTALEIAGYLR
jgi:hypothetical protein